MERKILYLLVLNYLNPKTEWGGDKMGMLLIVHMYIAY
jgi:hypothetical protein